MIEQETGLNDSEFLQFQAETMRQFKESDAYKLLRRYIVYLIRRCTEGLLDRRVKREDRMVELVSEIRAYHAILEMIDAPERERDSMVAMREQEKVEKQEEAYFEVPEYRGAGGVM